MSLTRSQRKLADAFWSHWKTLLAAGAADRDTLEAAMDEGDRLLGAYDEALGVEIYVDDAGQPALLLTAYGNSERLQSVDDLIDSQPQLPGLPVLALRPPGNPDFELEIEEQLFSSAQVWFDVLQDEEDPAFLGLEIYFPREIIASDDALFMVATLMVQMLIGERAFMERIDLLRLGDRSADPEDFEPLGSLIKLIGPAGSQARH